MATELNSATSKPKYRTYEKLGTHTHMMQFYKLVIVNGCFCRRKYRYESGVLTRDYEYGERIEIRNWQEEADMLRGLNSSF